MKDFVALCRIIVNSCTSYFTQRGEIDDLQNIKGGIC